MDIRKWHVVDLHYNDNEQTEADKLRKQYERQGYTLENRDTGSVTDNCDQYIKWLAQPKPKADKNRCTHEFVENKGIFICKTCGDTMAGWLHKEKPAKSK